MLLTTDSLLVNYLYGMPQLQHLQFWTEDSGPRDTQHLPLRECTQPSSTVILPSTCDILKQKYYLVASWPHWMMPLNEHLHQKILGMKVGANVWMFPLHYIENHEHFTSFHTRIFILWNLATPRIHPSPSYPPCSTCHWLTLWRRHYFLTYARKQLIMKMTYWLIAFPA